MNNLSSIKSWQIYLVFFVSGASALVYQVLWLRWLSLVFGNTTASVSIVLASFMCGLALGSAVIGKRLSRIRRPLRAYALVEVAIGAFAVAFPATSSVVEAAFSALIQPDTSSGVALAVRAVLSFLILLVPTALMGATLPLLTDFFRRNPRASREWKVGVLYAANTLGAAAGVLISSLVLIEMLGVRMTTLLAALLNFGVAWIAWRLGGDADASVEVVPKRPGESVSANAQLAVAVLTATGALSLAAEVLWTRTMETLMGTSTYAFSCIVFVFLVGIAVGSWVMSLWVARIVDKAAALLMLVLFMSVWMVAGIFLFFHLATHLGAVPGAMVGLGTIFLIYFKVVLLLTPLALASGACFPLATHILTSVGHETGGALVARAYMWNTIGSVAGSLVGGFIVAPFFDYMPALFVIAAGYALCGLVGAFFVANDGGGQRGRWKIAVAGLVIFSGGLVLFARDTPYRVRLAGSNGMEVVFHRPGIQAVTTALRVPGTELACNLLVNGMGMTTKVTDTKMMAHLPMLLHPAPHDTLVICFGMGTTYRSALTYGGNVTVVELVSDVLEVFPYFYEDAAEVLKNPRGRRVVNDGRNFLATARERFDVITLDPPPPIDGAGVNNLYSLDFIELARDHLKEGGIMAHWYPYVGSTSGVDDVRSFLMLVNTFSTAFPHVYAIPGYRGVGLHLIGSMQPIDISMEKIQARLQDPAVARDMCEFDNIPFSYFSRLALGPSPHKELLLVTDDHPLLEFYFLRTALDGGEKMVPYHYWSNGR